MEQQNIKKETRARNVNYHSKTLGLICDYIYEQTGCVKCRKRKFCSRDGDKWSCLPYNNIANHLNHIKYPSSRGNIGKWDIKPVREQITRGMRPLSDKEKAERRQQLNDQRDSEVVLETHERTEGTEEMMRVIEDEFGSIHIVVGADVDVILDSLRKEITTFHNNGKSVSVLLVPV